MATTIYITKTKNNHQIIIYENGFKIGEINGTPKQMQDILEVISCGVNDPSTVTTTISETIIKDKNIS